MPNVPKREEIPARMVEHAVQDHADALVVAFRHEVFQVRVGAQPAVQFFVIRCFIAVSHGLKQRPDVRRRAQPLLFPRRYAIIFNIDSAYPLISLI